jgi:hypothetical protein
MALLYSPGILAKAALNSTIYCSSKSDKSPFATYDYIPLFIISAFEIDKLIFCSNAVLDISLLKLSKSLKLCSSSNN